MVVLSVIIATFNSQTTLPLVLASLRRQSYKFVDMEILVVDGGSNDKTLTIARKFDCRVIHNSKVEPVYAKYLGYIHAKGKYIMYLDHDEVIKNRDSIKNKITLLKTNPSLKVIISSGYSSPVGYKAINSYINEFGDPFSFFMYNLSKNPNFFLKTMRSRYKIVKETKQYTIFDLSSSSELPIIELTTAASIIDGDYFKKTFPQVKNSYHLIPHLLHLLRSSYPHIAILKNDDLVHYSSDNFKKYLQKLVWRVKNNIFYIDTIGASGFSGRENYDKSLKRMKKYFFVPYALTLIMPFADAFHLMLTRKDISYIVHVPITIITAFLIVYFSMLRALGSHPKLMSYDGSVRAYEKR